MTFLTNSPAVMGILNTTPDSFYDGGKHNALEPAITRALQMIEEGADIIDIGGESTGPGSEEVSVEEELKRVMPVIKEIKQCRNKTIISTDTYKAEVAKKALDAGAHMINDITAGRGDAEMFAVIADSGCQYIMMRSKDNSARTTVNAITYDDVLKVVHSFFEERIAEAESAGVKRKQIILDPGLGHFVSSSGTYSWQILENLEALQDFGCRLLVSPSRKSFTATNPDEPAAKRLEGTLKATRIALDHGANIIRTHDVIQTMELIRQVPK